MSLLSQVIVQSPDEITEKSLQSSDGSCVCEDFVGSVQIWLSKLKVQQILVHCLTVHILMCITENYCYHQQYLILNTSIQRSHLLSGIFGETNQSELAAFVSYALAFPRNFLALVDTYDVSETRLVYMFSLSLLTMLHLHGGNLFF